MAAVSGLSRMKRIEEADEFSLSGLLGVLPSQAANILKQHATITQAIGTSETGFWSIYDVDPKDNCEYLSIDACHMGIEWRPVSDSDSGPADPECLKSNVDTDGQSKLPVVLHEPVFVRSKDPVKASHQMIFQVFPDRSEYASGDLFAPHPTRLSTWKYAGRVDDLILFSHGVKFHPAGIEERIQSSHPWIQTVLMWGDQHWQAILLLELTNEGLVHVERGDQKAAEFKIELDRLLGKVNEEAPVIAQIARTHVILAGGEKPLPRTAKGSIRRGEVAKLYQSEMDEVYHRFGDRAPSTTTRIR